VEIKTFYFSVYDAVATYNKGNISKCEVIQRLGIKHGQNAIKFVSLDQKRQQNSEMTENDLKENARQQR
jgi:hypothetical protein